MTPDRAYLRAKALEVLTKNLNIGLLNEAHIHTPGAKEQIHAELLRMSCMAAKLGDMLHDFPAHDPETGEQPIPKEEGDPQRDPARGVYKSARIEEDPPSLSVAEKARIRKVIQKIRAATHDTRDQDDFWAFLDNLEVHYA